MRALMVYLVEVLVCSGVMLAAYRILMERRASFRLSRLYLIITPILALIIPLLKIPVWAPDKVVESVEIGTFDIGMVGTEMVLTEVADTPTITPEAIAIAIYALGTTLMLWGVVNQMLKISSIKRGAQVEHRKDYDLFMVLPRITPFSFLRSIFIWSQTEKEELAAIICHERSHIRHRHTFERLAMELLKVVLWWNPFVWLQSRYLTEIQEYEADKDVIASGCDTTQYMNTILKQILGCNPEITNGLRNSLTKKRFKMMTTKRGAKYSSIRLLATMPAVVALMCIFSFTTRAAEAEDVTTTTQIALSGDDEPVMVTETMPTFEGGDLNDFRLWVMKQLVYPSEAVKNKIEGRETVAFLIEKDGSISNIRSVQSADNQLFKEVERILKLSPKWSPGINKSGKKVRVALVLPIDFRLMREKKSNEVDEIVVATASTSVEKPTALLLEDKNDPDTPFVVAETMPKFEGGGLLEFRQWVAAQIKYPEEAKKAGIQGREVVQFIIERDGSISNIESIQSVDPQFKREVERILKLSPKWTPGEQKGKIVRVKYMLPIDFVLPKNSSAAVSIEEPKLSGKVVNVSANEQKADELSKLYGKPIGIKTDGKATTNGDAAAILADGADANTLFIVDGVEMSREELKKQGAGNFNAITMLNGEKAIALYGDKGKDGVIIFSTRDTSKGSSENSKVPAIYVDGKKVEDGTSLDDIKANDAKSVNVDSNGDIYVTTKGKVATVRVEGAKGKPLYIVDGAEFSEEQFRTIDPEYIESVTVLKDASATSQYGDKAKDGVIVVKMKGEQPKDMVIVPLKDKDSDMSVVVGKEVTQNSDGSKSEDMSVLILREEGNGKPAQIVIKGDASSIKEGVKPTIYVDGKEVEDDFKLKDMAADTIESIEVVESGARLNITTKRKN